MVQRLLSCFLLCKLFVIHAEELPITLLIPSYNNAQWYNNNLNSVFQQKYKNFRVIYINDCSSDETGSLVENLVKSKTNDYQVVTFTSSPQEDIATATQRFQNLINQTRCFFTLVNNATRSLVLTNVYRSVHSCPDNEIIAILDGDDWLNHNFVLQELNNLYSSGNVWLTHGKLIEYPNHNTAWSIPVPKEVIEQNTFRQNRLPSHLKTFYSWLFKKIRLEDLLYNGNFFPMTGDMAIMFPMIEMAGERHAFIGRINYVYNTATPLNDNKVDPQLQNDMDDYIRALPRYDRLDKSPLQ